MDGSVISRLTSRLYGGEVGNRPAPSPVDTVPSTTGTNLLPDGRGQPQQHRTWKTSQTDWRTRPWRHYSILSDVVVVVDVATGVPARSYDL